VEGAGEAMTTVAATIYSSILDLYAAMSGVAAEYPKLFGTISGGAILTALWAYWRRPIINVRLGKKAGSYAPVTVDLKNAQGEIVGRVPAKYLRVLVKDAGLTTIKDCSGQLLKITRRVAGKKPEYFYAERYVFGWANYSQSDKRDIARWQSFHMDVATLVLLSNDESQLFFGGFGRHMPNTLADFLNSYAGRARYTYDLLIGADNARPRKVPVEVVFGPDQTELTFIPLNTRYPWWRLLWWLRAQWSRRRQGSGKR
jgi:hypothetical protein